MLSFKKFIGEKWLFSRKVFGTKVELLDFYVSPSIKDLQEIKSTNTRQTVRFFIDIDEKEVYAWNGEIPHLKAFPFLKDKIKTLKNKEIDDDSLIRAGGLFKGKKFQVEYSYLSFEETKDFHKQLSFKKKYDRSDFTFINKFKRIGLDKIYDDIITNHYYSMDDFEKRIKKINSITIDDDDDVIFADE